MAAPDGSLRALLREQAALRRVATLVAMSTDPMSVFSSVTEEVGRVLGAHTANMVRYRQDGFADVVGGWNEPGFPSVPVGARLALDGETLTPRIRRSGRPERVDDYQPLDGELAARLRELGIRSGVGAPIVLDGALWGSVVVSSVHAHGFPPGAEERVAAFTELVAHALANAEAREQLVASRARVVAAADAERRRLERNLHDGAQQRLVTMALELGLLDRLIDHDVMAAHAALGHLRHELEQSLTELRELAQGLHPAVLTRHGLQVAVPTLARRALMPVEVTIDLRERPAEPVEVAAYYVVAESLTNVAKYASATSARIEIIELEERLFVEVADNGIGGADPAGGSGLQGLEDRVEAIGGRLHVESVPGRGTAVRADLPTMRTPRRDEIL